MKLFIVSDVHADASTSGVDRFSEIHDAIHFVADEAINEKERGQEVLFVFAGDLCDPDTTRSFRAIGLAIDIACLLSFARVPSLWIAGNHDVIENERGSTVLEPLRAVSECVPRIKVVDREDGICRHYNDRIAVIALPYVARANHYDPSEFIRDRCYGLGEKEGFKPPIVIGHLTVPSAERGSESDDFARGRDMIFPVAECRRRWGDRCILVNGHYHRKQITKDGVHIPGSLARLRHDEEHHEPGYLVIEV
jgi:DNA repair exonuclease SbcCD nuclease subunit